MPHSRLLNEVPEHMAQEFEHSGDVGGIVGSSMKFLSTWLRNNRMGLWRGPMLPVLNEVPEHMAQESHGPASPSRFPYPQ